VVELKHSQIRSAILEEHEQLRARMKELEASLDGPSGMTSSFPVALKAFLVEFLKHIAHEDELLRPVLVQVDAWARQRVESLDREHQDQRRKLTELAQMDPSSDPSAFAARAREVLEWIRVDMAGEEKTLLTPELLRDDIIVIDSFGG
jgi:hypothetical protein